MRKIRFAIAAACLAASCTAAWAADSASEARTIPVQHFGRVKTFESFARESLELIAGRDRWQKRPAIAWMLEAAADPAQAADWRWLRVDYRPLADRLGLEKDRSHYSYAEVIVALDQIEPLLQSASDKRDAEQTPTLLERKAETLYTGLSISKSIIDGRAFRVVPPPTGAAGEEWLLVAGAPAEWREPFDELLRSWRAGGGEAFAAAAEAWNRRVDTRIPSDLRRKLELEGLYFSMRPFAWAAAAYLLGFVFLLARRSKRARHVGTGLLLAGLAFHTAGLVLRSLILDRPPVSNMYESMIWMNWVLMVSAGVFAALRREHTALTVGSVASAVVMIYGDLLPIDTGLDVLVPVLRSNYWLTIHVLTIVSSYGLFGLAMALAHRHLWLDRWGLFEKGGEESSAQLIYRSIQVGLLLLGIGTVLGGVWANESWGRFWGWDPKETWALITFLGYLVVVHLHYARVIKPFSLALCAIGGFLLVLFTWYGVNFVLGKGLHSYGQGSGGLNWVLAYLVFEALFAAWVLAEKLRRPAR